MSIKPITPREAKSVTRVLPDVVIATWNEAIVEKMKSGVVTITQDYIIEKLMAATGLERMEIFDSGYLNIEDIYRKAGWYVFYDKPGYNESYQPYYRFQEN